MKRLASALLLTAALVLAVFAPWMGGDAWKALVSAFFLMFAGVALIVTPK